MNEMNSQTKFEQYVPARARAFSRSLTPRGRWTIAAGVVAAVALGSAYFYFQSDSATTYKTATVTVGNIEQAVTALGALQPKDYVDVGAQVSGTLESVHVEIGDLVTKGQLLAEVDPTVYESTVAFDKAKLKDLEAQIKGQQAQLALAVLQNKRNQGLLKIDAVSKDVAETSAAQVQLYSANIEASRAQLEQSQSTLSGDEANLSYTKIYAPMTGTVTSQTTLQGQTLNSNQTAPTILQIADLTVMTVKAQVAEADVSKLKLGMPAYFTTLGMSDRKWRSTVRQILPTPETINDVILYNALIDVENPDQALMTSMTAQVFFVLGEAENALLVPLAALKTGRDGGSRVLVLKDGVAKMTPVEVGLQNRVSAEITSGLKEGDVVVTGTQSSTNTAKASNSSTLGGRMGPPR
ncbi:MAG: efflux RND transporter periplasmic adaptor subunit [Parvibaculum sp.]|nr:efflux RND transporter periplasmic adaptor subunit [Parvibaculum sp.]